MKNQQKQGFLGDFGAYGPYLSTGPLSGKNMTANITGARGGGALQRAAL